MALFPYQRLAYLFDVITNETLPQQELAKRFNITTRTIRSDVLLLNDILTPYGCKIEHKKGLGYQFDIVDNNAYQTFPHQQQQLKSIPRSSNERVLALLILFFSQREPIKIDDLAEAWFTSRGTIQTDLIEVRQVIEKYHLSIDKKPHYGMSLIGEEANIRCCLTDIIWQMHTADDIRSVTQLKQNLLNNIDLDYLSKLLQSQFERFNLIVKAEGKGYLLYSCAVSIARITMGKELTQYTVSKIDEAIKAAASKLASGFSYFLGSDLSEPELNYLCIQIISRIVGDSTHVLAEIQQTSLQLIDHILNEINHNYKYDLRTDMTLKNDLYVHISSMLSRIQYQILSSNPLLNEIKQYYPFAYDVTVSALANLKLHHQFKLSEDEISYLAVHIGVALERNFSKSNQRHPSILLVSELGNATLKMIESKIVHNFPHVNILQRLSYSEYEQQTSVEQDIVVTTVRLTEKNRPIVKVTPFPTTYQLEQLGRLVMVDRTNPYILEHFFSEQFFIIIDKPMTQQALFKLVCQKLKQADYIDDDFYPSLIERENIVSTMLGENIAIPHSVGLLAKKTIVVTILAPQGIKWDKSGDANVIFLFAISREEYEQAMSIYSLFVNFVKERSTKRLLNSRSFAEFIAIAKDSFVRIS